MWCSRLRVPAPKTRCARRALAQQCDSDRSTGSRGLRDNHGPCAPDPAFTPDGPNTDPLLTGSLAAGERLARDTGQGGYAELESVPFGSASLSKNREGRVAEAELCL